MDARPANEAKSKKKHRFFSGLCSALHEIKITVVSRLYYFIAAFTFGVAN
jgi:hypothetical protein